MTLKIEELQRLVDVTGAESDAVKGGYAGFVTFRTGNPITGFTVSNIVRGRFARDPQVIAAQRSLKLSENTILTGIAIADTSGGVFFPAQATAKLGG